MPNPTRTPTISPNNLIAIATAHTTQFQTLFYNFKVLCVDSGATISLSNGTVSGVATYGASDNIPNVAGVTLGAAGTGAWFVATWSNLGGQAISLLFAVSASADPRRNIQYAIGPGPFTGGSTSALPTFTAGTASALATLALHPFTTARNLRYTTWRTANASGAQSIRFLVKEEGTGVEASNCFFITIEGNTDSDGGGSQNQRWFAFASVSLTSSMATGGGVSVNTSGTTAVVAIGQSALWSIATSWTNGQDQANNECLQPILVGCNSAAGRLFGTWVDVYAIPALSALGVFLSTAESGQTYRRIAIGDYGFYWPTGTALS